MIYYLATARNSFTMRMFLASPLGLAFRSMVSVITYEELNCRDIQSGTVIFSDLELLSDRRRREMSRLYEELKGRLGEGALLNHPARSWRRYELLRGLHAAGINDFNVWRLRDLMPWRRGREPLAFPVFIRNENDHTGPHSPVIRSRAVFWLQVLRQFCRPGRMGGKIATGFLDTSDDSGLFRKYSVFRVGPAIIPRHIFFSRHWMIKEAQDCGPTFIEEELSYVKTNPHSDELMKIFEMAGIRYGRIDYSLRGGRIQVWEINTNPMLVSFDCHLRPERAEAHNLFAKRLEETLSSL
jgi:hypothetical protein